MEERSFLTHSGIIPPFPEGSKSTEKNASAKTADGLVEPGSDPVGKKSSYPSRLLSLVRSIEKREKGTENYEAGMRETVDLFNHLIAVYSRYGLLRGDLEKADHILSTENSAPSGRAMEGRKRGSKKGRKGNKNHNSDDLRIKHHPGSIPGSSNSQQQDEALVFTAILRILAPTGSGDDFNGVGYANNLDEDRALLISLASELCLAISQHMKIEKESDTCNLAEYQLLAQSGKPILAGLLNIIKMIVHDMAIKSDRKKDEKCLTLMDWDEQIHILTLNTCMKLACSLVTLFGTKLSRSTAMLLDLNTTCWKLLTIDNDSVQDSAARLLSSLPMAGGIDRKNPSIIWSACVSDTLSGLAVILETMAPLTKGSDKEYKNNRLHASLDEWIHFVRRDISNESFRLKCFYRFSRGLTKVFHFLLLQDGLDRSSTLVDAQIDVKKVLGVVESFVSFPLSAETIYYRTKRRLRNEIIDNGLLSPRIIATEVANHIKLMGHEILDSMLDAVGGPVLLPYARRILRISYASILTSSSSPVRRVMDPTSAAQLEGKKRRWLHLSVSSRALAIKSFGSVIAAFGCDSSTSSGSLSKASPSADSLTANTDSEKAITLVVGSLIEQISTNSGQTSDYDGDWGTTAERVELVSSSAMCLGMNLVSCGGFLSLSIRSLIESVVVSALSKIGETRQSGTEILSWAPVKISILRLANSCVTTPWQDGASSSLVDLLTSTARTLKDDVDIEVSTIANTALRICDSLSIPRAPALIYVNRAVGSGNSSGIDSGPSAIATTDSASLATNIESARNDAVRARKAALEIELTKKRKAEDRRQQDKKKKNETDNKRQKAFEEKKSTEMKKPDQTLESKSRPSRDKSIKVDKTIKTDSKDYKQSSKSDPPNTDSETKHGVMTKVETSDRGKDGNELVGDENKMKAGDDAMEIDDKSIKSDDDDDELPEIFDGGPDSDDE
ncbi:unnamed protein product [Pseudo-nitzschia multistriata]|uniref:Pre-rRNA-processing protein RIX1 N-terminal domain-containing protein n=1 Tax=Pseudo-nitzschia multistriata TaxID=183589 RepID=A0A448ZAJ9_9STRA|nr:unnamed protein product [Pseudo-nitzschia multistriata]